MRDILLNLQGRFKAVEEARNSTDDTDLLWALFEYSNFIGTSAKISAVVKELAHESEIDHGIFQLLFLYSTLCLGVRDSQHNKRTLSLPLFHDAQVEKDYGLMSGFRKLIALEEKRLQESKKQGVRVSDIVLAEDAGEMGMTSNKEYLGFRHLHNEIVQLLTIGKSEDGTENEKLHFNENTSRLYVLGKEIKIQKFCDQYHLLRVMFEDGKEIGKEWFFSEVEEKIDSFSHKEKRYYNAAYQVGLKARAAGFADFFITTRQSVKIDPEYLS